LNIFSRTFHVGPYKIEAVALIENGQAISLNFEWSPDLPETLSNAEIAEYHQQRDAALADLAQDISTRNPIVLEV
jgi:hypothetical protein